jgi:hypothetical protein
MRRWGRTCRIIWRHRGRLANGATPHGHRALRAAAWRVTDGRLIGPVPTGRRRGCRPRTRTLDGLRAEPGGALRVLDGSQRLRERPHGPQQDGGLLAVELAMRKSLRDGVDRNRRVGERDQTGEIEVERPVTQARHEAVHAGAQRRRVAVERTGDRRLRQVAGAVVEQLLGDDGGLVARSARASRRIAALAGPEGHVGSPRLIFGRRGV